MEGGGVREALDRGAGRAYRIEIRRGRPEDLPALTEIYNHYVRETPITFDVEPFSVEGRRPWFEQFTERGRYQIVVAEDGGRVVGYACTLPFRPKAAYVTSVETSIYVADGLLGRGIGTSLYSALFERLPKSEVHRAYAGVTLPNAPSVALHRSFGFRSVGVYHEVGWKLSRYWDVEWVEKDLG
jgi:phosphinothricin acetyltransferase